MKSKHPNKDPLLLSTQSHWLQISSGDLKETADLSRNTN